MSKQHIYHYFKRTIPALIAVLTIVGCTGKVSQPEPSSTLAASPSPTIVATALPTSSIEPTLSPTPPSAPTPEPAVDKNVLYQDDFANPSSGWPKEKYDNFFIGYHEPDYYHIDVRSANDKELVPVPGKQSFGDVTVEAKIFTDPNNTATTGNFRYGLIFRRSGDQYYAFTISPRTKSWYVLKSSPSSLEVLKEGTEDSIQGLEAEDGLRVDTKGTTFFFRINDRLVGEVSDPDYAKGEVGLYVQTFDIPHVHVHFDSLTIRNVEAPQLICSVISIALNVRSGPSKSFDPPIIFLARGGRMEPLGRSPDGEWIRVKVEGSDQQGWIFNSAEFVSCNVAVADLPVIEP